MELALLQMSKKSNRRYSSLKMTWLVAAVAPTLAGVILCSASGVAQQPARQDKQIQTLAVVNGQRVSRQQLATECMRRFGEDVLESIINKQLVFNECQRVGIRITEQDVNDEIINEAKKFGMSGEKYMQLITTERKIAPDRYKNDIIWSKIALRRLASNDLQVTTEEINAQLDFEFGPKVKVREIVVGNAKLAHQILAQVRQSPSTFERMAMDHSVNQNSASIGGILPPIRRNSGMAQFEKIAFGLQVDQISDVFQIEDKFIILKCDQIFPPTQIPQTEMADIQDKIVSRISAGKLADAASRLFQRLQQTVKIVNVHNDPALRKRMPGVAAMVDDTKITKRYLAEECIARFGHVMLETEINRTLLSQALSKNNKQVQQDDINTEIARAAESIGRTQKDGSVDVAGFLDFVTDGDRNKIEFYIEDEVWPTVALKILVADQVAVSEEDMKKAFDANYGPRVTVRAIVSSDHRQALKVWQMANANKSRKYFGQLATQYSIDPMGKNNNGIVPPIQKYGGRPELEREAFGLKNGELSKVIQIGENWIVMYCTGRTSPVVANIDDVWDELNKNVLEKKMRIAMSAEFDRLRTSAQIDNYIAGTSQSGRSANRQATAPGNQRQPRRSP